MYHCVQVQFINSTFVHRGSCHGSAGYRTVAPPWKRGRSIPATSSRLEDAHFPQRTRSQSRSVVGPHIPFIHPPPTIPESPLAPGHSSPLSELEEVPGIAISDILQDHILES